jgi:pyruvate dehydrogenase E2 component (dihydrolipoamide acetyltransferase)
MATEFKLPELGENIEAADVSNVLVKVGDIIIKDQPIIEIETDKATIEVPATVEGIVTKIFIKAGDQVKVGATVLLVEEADESKKKIMSESESNGKKNQTEKETEPKQKTEQIKSSNKKEIVEFILTDL